MIERLQRHPFLLAYWLTTCNRLRSSSQHPRRWWLVVGGLLALASSTLVIRYRVAHAPLPAAVTQYAVWVVVLAALHATAVVTNGRKLAIRDLTQSWLAATPLAAASLPLAIVLRALWPLVWQASLCLLLILYALVAGLIDRPLTGRLLLLILVGASIGGGIGWYLGRVRAPAALAPLKSVVVPEAVRAPPIGASLQALSGWPIAQVLMWANPKALRWPFIWACLTVPIGASAIEGLFVIAAWAMLFYMVALLPGVAVVAQDAGRWLRVTPLSLWSFTQGLLRRTLLHLLAATVVMSVLLWFAYGVDGTFWTLYVWISILIAAFSIAVTVGRTARDVRLPMLFGVAAVLTVAALSPIFAAPVAVSCGAWCWRRGRRS